MMAQPSPAEENLFPEICTVVGCEAKRAKETLYCPNHDELFKKKTALPFITGSRKTTVRRSMSKKSQKLDPVESETEQAWKNARKVVFKDLPRLARRMTVQSATQGVLVRDGKWVTKDEKEDEEEESDLKHRWSSISNAVFAVAQWFEPQHRMAAIAQQLSSLGAEVKGEQTDLQSLVERLFVKGIGLNSQTFKVFRACHQGILFPALHHLHTQVFQGVGHMKDVRRADGWTISISTGDAIAITHRRWEQNLAAPSDPGHFECRWEIRLSFDRDMQKLCAVFVRIIDLSFHEDMDAQKRQSISEKLRGGGYIV